MHVPVFGSIHVKHLTTLLANPAKGQPLAESVGFKGRHLIKIGQEDFVGALPVPGLGSVASLGTVQDSRGGFAQSTAACVTSLPLPAVK